MAVSVSELPALGPSIAYSTSAAVTMITTISTHSSPATATANGVALGSLPTKPPRDSSWLELEICREFLRQGCSRSADECRFAHPESSVITKDSKVTCCYDFLKDRCHREKCKYFHPPLHIKQRLVAAGKQFGAMMSNVCMVAGGTYPAVMSPALSPASSMPVVGPDGQLIPSPTHGGYVPMAAVFSPWAAVNDRLPICPEFVRGQCSVTLCPFVHPDSHIRQNVDSTVTVCRDFVRGGCSRNECRYYHPLPHIAAQMIQTQQMAAMGSYMPPGMMMTPAIVPGFAPVVYHPTSPVTPIPVATPSPIATPVTSASIPLYPGFSAVPGPIPPGVPISHGVLMSNPSPVPAAVVPVPAVQLEPPSSPTAVPVNGHVSAESISAAKSMIVPPPFQLIQ